MGDASLRVQTKYPNAGALLHVVGTTLQRGSLRVPIPVGFDGPFELILASLDGDEPVCGKAEVVEHAGDATWVRFLSASPDSTEPARRVLVDTEVMSPAPLTVKPGEFEAVTAVNETASIASLPLPPPRDPLFDVSDASRPHLLPPPPPPVSSSSSSIAEAAAAACEVEARPPTAVVDFASGPTSVREGETTMVESRRDVDVAALAALEGRFDALNDVIPPAERVTARGEAVGIGEPPAVVATADIAERVTAPTNAVTYASTIGEPPAMPDTLAAEEDDLRVPLTGEHLPLVVDAATDEAPRTELSMPALEAVPTDRPTQESLPVDAPAIIYDSTPPDDQRPTVESPPIVATLVKMTAGDDAIAASRGVRAITNPYAKGGAPTSSSSTKRIMIAAASVAAVSMLVAAGSIMWAHDAVARAEHSPSMPAPIAQAAPAPVAEPVVEQPIVAQPSVEQPVAAQPPVEQPVAEQPVVAQPSVAQPPVAQPTTCTLDVFSSVADASVYVNGAANGSTPATANVACGKPVTIEIRHARYESFKRTVTPTAGREELRATLEREKTSLHVTSEPAGANVTYNGAPIGKTPLTVKIPRYEQGTLNFSMPGMQADWRRIVPKSAEKTVTIALRKK